MTRKISCERVGDGIIGGLTGLLNGAMSVDVQSRTAAPLDNQASPPRNGLTASLVVGTGTLLVMSCAR
jgi:hypothetical protein